MLPLKRKRCSYSSWFLLLTVIIVSAGCSAFMHGYTTQEYANQMLPASVGKGAKRLEMEVNFNKPIRDLVQNRGTPDYIYVVSNKKYI